MSRERRTAAVAALACSGGLLFAGVAGGDAEIARIGWLSGCWERRTSSSLVEEQWMAPRGGTMLGMSRTVRSDRTVAHETIRIEERDGRLVYIASPSGQATAEFTSTHVSDTLVAFENPVHDFPQRILYRPGGADSLWARIEGARGGETRGVDFRMSRAPCAGERPQGERG
jgi:hypothetical protein